MTTTPQSHSTAFRALCTVCTRGFVGDYDAAVTWTVEHPGICPNCATEIRPSAPVPPIPPGADNWELIDAPHSDDWYVSSCTTPTVEPYVNVAAYLHPGGDLTEVDVNIHVGDKAITFQSAEQARIAAAGLLAAADLFDQWAAQNNSPVVSS